jgi:hypothetical protein
MNYSKYVSKKLPNSYIAGWSWFYGRTEAASVAQSAKQGEFWPNGAPDLPTNSFLNTGLQMASLSYDSDHCSI